VTAWTLLASLLLGTGSLAWGYFERGWAEPAAAMLAVGPLWALAVWRRWTWFSSLGLVLCVLAAAAGLWLGLAPGWMLAGSVGGLLAWDLTDFARRLRDARAGEDLRNLERAHLARLGLVGLLGSLLGTIAMRVSLRLTFEWALLAGLLAAWKDG
jgi:hypothetical protein